MKQSILLSVALLPALVCAMSITEVVQKSVETHPQIQVKKEELNVQKESLTVVRSDYLPTVDLSYSVGPEVTKTIANQREQAELIRQDAAATLKLNVFSGLETMYGVKQQKALILSAGDNVKDSANTLALEAATAYINVLKNQELLQIAKENVEVHEKYLNQIKTKVDAGVGRTSDYKQTLSRFENAKSVMYLAEQNYDNSISSFQRILPGAVTAADLEKPAAGAMPADTLEALIELAMKNNPTIQVSKDDIQVAKAALTRSNAPYYPRADIVAEAYWNKDVHGVSADSDNPVVSAFSAEDSGYNALLVLNYNIFNGLADSATKQVNQHRLLQKNSTLADSERYIKAYTQIAYQTYQSTMTQLVHINNNIKASADTVADYQKENELGRRSIIDLLNIELEYNAARNRKVTAEYDNLLAYYQILSYTGKMLEEMNVAIK
jgi:adhesin transport system outer membrane protein